MCIFETTGDAEQAFEIASAEPLGFMHDTANAILGHRLGDRDAAQQHLDGMITSYGESASYQYGQIYAQWGDIDNALKWLETALDVRDPGLGLAGTDSLLDPLRVDHEFAASPARTAVSAARRVYVAFTHPMVRPVVRDVRRI